MNIDIIPNERYSLKLGYVILNIVLFTLTLSKHQYFLWLLPSVVFKFGHQLALLTYSDKRRLKSIDKTKLISKNSKKTDIKTQ